MCKNHFLPDKPYFGIMNSTRQEQATIPPPEIPLQAEALALQKVKKPACKTLILGFLGGAYISMGGLFSVIISYGFPEWTATNPGLQKLLMGATFPIGLMLVVFAGAELFTSNNATFIPGVLNKRYSWRKVMKNWSLVWLSNFVGALFFAYVLVFLTKIIVDDPWQSGIIHLAEAKTSYPWHIIFLKGIGANWLVCLAIWLGLASRTPTGKMLGIWFPVMCFVAIGFEHSIANMFFIPLGMLQGADISLATFICGNLIPATLGNIVGGVLFVGGAHWYVNK